MVSTAYNLQEALFPLMQKLGRHMRGERIAGYKRLVSVVSDALEVGPERADRLVASLLSNGLVGFEADPDTGGAADRGTWRIGPCL